jgi:hypothetical protein
MRSTTTPPSTVELSAICREGASRARRKITNPVRLAGACLFSNSLRPRANEAYDARIRQSHLEIPGGASHAQPRQAGSREEKAKEKAIKDVEQASETGGTI